MLCSGCRSWVGKLRGACVGRRGRRSCRDFWGGASEDRVPAVESGGSGEGQTFVKGLAPPPYFQSQIWGFKFHKRSVHNTLKLDDQVMSFAKYMLYCL